MSHSQAVDLYWRMMIIFITSIFLLDSCVNKYEMNEQLLIDPGGLDLCTLMLLIDPLKF